MDNKKYNDKEFNLELPEISNRKHKAFLINYAQGMDKIASYLEVYGPDVKETSAAVSASILLNNPDYIKFLDIYEEIKIQRYIDKQIDISLDNLNPFLIINKLNEIAHKQRNSHPSISRDIYIYLLSLSGLNIVDMLASLSEDNLSKLGLEEYLKNDIK